MQACVFDTSNALIQYALGPELPICSVRTSIKACRL